MSIISFLIGSKEERTEEKMKRVELKEKIALLDRFPGSLAEYNDFKGEEHEIIDTGRPQKYVTEDEMFMGEETFVFQRQLIDAGCVALVRYNLDWGPRSGMPVRKKNKTPNN